MVNFSGRLVNEEHNLDIELAERPVLYGRVIHTYTMELTFFSIDIEGGETQDYGSVLIALMRFP